MRDWCPAGAEFEPLGLTLDKPHQGKLGWETFPAGVYPSCSKHGAMNRVASAPLWRCLNCNIGGELVGQFKTEGMPPHGRRDVESGVVVSGPVARAQVETVNTVYNRTRLEENAHG